jgi:hypothetical protein
MPFLKLSDTTWTWIIYISVIILIAGLLAWYFTKNPSASGVAQYLTPDPGEVEIGQHL